MKKYIYLCGMMLLSANMMAQIDLNDGYWDIVINEDFNVAGRTWNPESFLSSDRLWRAYPGHGLTSSINNTTYPMVYQFTHCHFNDIDGVMELVSEYDYNGIINSNSYYLPSWMQASGGPGYPPNNDLYFFSGNIDYVNYSYQEHTIDKFLFGYFEIRCKLPIHNGSWPAFWLFGNGPDTYEEIDILEYTSTDGCDNDPLRGYSMGIWHNPDGTNYIENNENLGARKYFKDFHHLPLSSPDLSQYHTYGCEWMPDYVKWYCDGHLVAEYRDIAHVPQYPKTLKITYGLKDYAVNGNHLPNGWSGSDELTIDYVRVYKLKTDCNTDELITTATQFVNYDNKMKRSITIWAPSGCLTVPSNTNISMRASDFILINGDFEIPSGTQATFMVHECPPANNVVHTEH